MKNEKTVQLFVNAVKRTMHPDIKMESVGAFLDDVVYK